jgi:hypothetical protein
MTGSLSSTTTPKYKRGDLVKHTSAFLQSCGWYTNVPKDGRVLDVDEEILTVEWSDGHSSRIRDSNIMPAGKPDYTGL